MKILADFIKEKKNEVKTPPGSFYVTSRSGQSFEN